MPNANTENSDALLRIAQRNLSSLVDSLEEINYRQSAFLRALHAASADPDLIHKHATALRDLYHDAAPMMDIYCLENSKS